VATGVLPGTVARGLTTLAVAFDQGTSAHVADLGELGFDLVPFELKAFQRESRQRASHLIALYAVR
jgi:hypothetical protein